MRIRSVAVSIALLCSSALAQNTWYVDAKALPPGDGSQAHPYPTITAAIDSSSTLSGDNVLVAPGTYTEDVVFAWGSVWKSVHLRSSLGPAATVIQGGLFFAGGSVDGFTVSSTLGVSTSFSPLRRCIVRNPGSMGATRGIWYDDYSSIDDCVVTGFEVGFTMFGFATAPGPITNTIAFGNGSVVTQFSIASFVNCCLPYVPTGFSISATHTVLGDPGFWDAAHADYHLAPGSPCIDMGAGTDPDGSIADIGALPYDPGYATGPSVYCSANPTSDGCVASISTSGLCSMTSSAPFLVTATQVPPNKLGRLLYSFGEASLPFQGGLLCLAPPLYRTPPSNSGSSGQPPCSGVLGYDFNARVQSGVDPQLQSGRVVFAQYRFRDPFAPGGYGVGFSDAVRFGIAP